MTGDIACFVGGHPSELLLVPGRQQIVSYLPTDGEHHGMDRDRVNVLIGAAVGFLVGGGLALAGVSLVDVFWLVMPGGHP